MVDPLLLLVAGVVVIAIAAGIAPRPGRPPSFGCPTRELVCGRDDA